MNNETPTSEQAAVLEMELDLDVEELEQIITPGHNLNHNETFLRD